MTQNKDLFVNDSVSVIMSESQGDTQDSETTSCYQIVLYKPDSILPMFHQEERQFEFAGKRWILNQQWGEIGVASVVWESALLLSQHLAELESPILSGTRIIELGAGTGLVGMVASALGASSVVLTDRDTRPAEINLEQNKHNLIGKNISTSKLLWGTDVVTFNPPYDVILAADVIYIEETFSDLIRTLEDLSDSKSLILLSCKRRYERHDHFFNKLLSTGKFMDEVVRVWPEREEVKVHKLTRIDIFTDHTV